MGKHSLVMIPLYHLLFTLSKLSVFLFIQMHFKFLLYWILKFSANYTQIVFQVMKEIKIMLHFEAIYPMIHWIIYNISTTIFQ